MIIQWIEIGFRITLDLIDFNNGLSEDSNLMKGTADCGVSLKIKFGAHNYAAR